MVARLIGLRFRLAGDSLEWCRGFLLRLSLGSMAPVSEWVLYACVRTIMLVGGPGVQASANGHGGCVDLLISAGAQHVCNDSGNTPLHWAVQNKHIDLVKTLLKTYADADVLSKNSFGKSVLTEVRTPPSEESKRPHPAHSDPAPCNGAHGSQHAAFLHACMHGANGGVLCPDVDGQAFGAGDEKVTQLLLEHKSAAELDKGNDQAGEGGEEGEEAATRKASETTAAGAGEGGQRDDGGAEDEGGGKGGKGDGGDGEAGEKAGETGAVAATAYDKVKAADANIVQTYTYDLDFDGDGVTGPNLKVREVATDWTGDVFSGATTAADDTTGMQVWATSLVFVRQLRHHF